MGHLHLRAVAGFPMQQRCWINIRYTKRHNQLSANIDYVGHAPGIYLFMAILKRSFERRKRKLVLISSSTRIEQVSIDLLDILFPTIFQNNSSRAFPVALDVN